MVYFTTKTSFLVSSFNSVNFFSFYLREFLKREIPNIFVDKSMTFFVKPDKSHLYKFISIKVC